MQTRRRPVIAQYTADVLWLRNEQGLPAGQYSRRHSLRFDGGLEIPGSSSPHVVPVPMSDPAALDPEEAFVAALASCHMLWFLSIAAAHDFRVERYRDAAVGTMGKNSDGRIAMTVVRLRPLAVFAGERQPTHEEIDRMHHEAHEACFIASSVKTAVTCELRYDDMRE